MDAAAEQLVLDYLRRLEDAARGKLGAADRMAFMARSRAAVARQIGETRATDADEVRRLLRRFGDPDRLATKERQRLAREAPAGQNGINKVPGPEAAGADAAGTAPGQDGADTAVGQYGAAPVRGQNDAGPRRGQHRAGSVPGHDRTNAAVGQNGAKPALGLNGAGAVPSQNGASAASVHSGASAVPSQNGASAGPGHNGASAASGQNEAGAVPDGERPAAAAPPVARPPGRLATVAAAGRQPAAAPALHRPMTARWRPGRDLPGRPAPGAAPDRTAGPDPGGGGEPGSVGGWLGGLLAVARKHPLECLAVVLIGLGGLIDPWPLWLIGALAMVASPLWDVRDKLAAVAIPLGVALVGAIALAGFSAHPPGLSGYLHAIRVDGWNLLRAGAVLGAVYLARRVPRGRRPRREPPWRLPPPGAR